MLKQLKIYVLVIEKIKMNKLMRRTKKIVKKNYIGRLKCYINNIRKKLIIKKS
jgi:hypothetical protein